MEKSVKTCPGCLEEKSISEFYNSSSRCKECVKQGMRDYRKTEKGKRLKREWNEKNKDKLLDQQRDRYYKIKTERPEEIERRRELNKKYREENKEKIKELMREWQQKNKDKCREYGARYRERLRKDEERLSKRREKRNRRNNKKEKSVDERLREYLSASVRRGIKNKKAGKPVEKYCDYTILELMNHLERQFVDGMSWENYGREGWHIDHRIPVSSFDFTDEKEVMACWALPNLQPMWAKDNMKKGDKVIYLL